MRYAKKTDKNHAEIRDGLRKDGWEVRDLSEIGHGVPDLAVRLNPRKTLLLEIKDGDKPPSGRKLKPSQDYWNEYFGYMTETVISLDEAREAVMRHFQG